MTTLRLALLSLLAACSGTTSPAAPPPTVDVKEIPPPKPGPDTPGPTASAVDTGARYTLVELQAGDHACYVVVKDASGKEENLPGSFELCPGGTVDATPFIGKSVTLERNQAPIAADSCQGDPECKDTQMVDLVVGLKPAL
ncbi:MAG: hypothetical protein Q8P41_05735 [Pseudomonadota bacterium]|nr:hypothetical protein [Pseudomonadota bacterium]